MRIARGISIANTSKPISTAAAYDADAVAFFTAASITNTTQKNAVNQLVLDLKSASIWTKMKALYPVVGGVASSHAVNLKTPGTFNLTFATGWTHSSTGMTPNGATYANTNFNAFANLINNNYHLSHYSRTQTNTGNSVDLSCSDSSGQMIGLTQFYQGTGKKGFVAGNYNNVVVEFVNTDTLGLLIGSRTSSTVAKMFMDGVQNGSTLTTLNTNALLNKNLYIGAQNSSIGPAEYSTKQCAFASIGDGLTDAEASAFYTAVQNYQTTLGRQV